MHIPIGTKPDKIRSLSVLPQSDIFTTPCDLFLNGETIFHHRPAHFYVHMYIRVTFFNFLSQSFALHIFLMQFDTLISNIVSDFQKSGKIAVAGRLKVNFGQF